MELIADGLLIAAALTSALYCWVLSRRLNALKRMDKGLGGAIAGLSARVEQTKESLADTKASTGGLTRELKTMTARAEIAAGRLEILLATLQDRPSANRDNDEPELSIGEKPNPVRRRSEAATVKTATESAVKPVETVKDPVADTDRPKPRLADQLNGGSSKIRLGADPASETGLQETLSRGSKAAAADGLSALRRIAGARSAR